MQNVVKLGARRDPEDRRQLTNIRRLLVISTRAEELVTGRAAREAVTGAWE